MSDCILDISTIKVNKLTSNGDPDPQLDCGTCSECGWTGKLSDCEKGQEGNYYDGYITEVYCPVCDDGGCIDSYYPSDESLAEWKRENVTASLAEKEGNE